MKVEFLPLHLFMAVVKVAVVEVVEVVLQVSFGVPGISNRSNFKGVLENKSVKVEFLPLSFFLM